MTNLSFINELPFELLTYIFDLSTRRGRFAYERHTFQYRPSRSAAPLNLIAVCRLWRSLALSTSSIWDAVSVLTSPEDIARMKGWLSIAPKVPFRLRLQASLYSTEDEADAECHALQLFSKRYTQWTTLYITLNQSLACEFTKFLQSADLASFRLSDLNITFLHGTQLPHDAITPIVSYLSVLPTIDNLSLKIDRSCNVDLRSLPWSQYKTVGLDHHSSPERHTSYISQCTTATNIRFQTEYFDGAVLPTPYSPPFTLTSLTSLDLGRGTDPLNLIAYFTLPNLSELVVDVYQRNHAALEGFLARSPSLRTLVIGEKREDFFYGFTGASDQDIVDWFCSSYLRLVPCFQLCFKDADKDGRKIIETFSAGSVAFPRLTCSSVEKMLSRESRSRFTSIGWGGPLDPDCEVFWTYKDGVFEC